MKTRLPDPIIAEVRAIRQAYAARFGYDMEAIFRDIRARQEASGREYVRPAGLRPAGRSRHWSSTARIATADADEGR